MDGHIDISNTEYNYRGHNYKGANFKIILPQNKIEEVSSILEA
jgi:hypothetical protein